MPRIYTSASDPIDLCVAHYPKTEAIAFSRFGHEGDGPDGRGNCFGYEAEHPPYENENYRCYTCHKKLTEMDN